MFGFFKRKLTPSANDMTSSDPWTLSEDEQLEDDVGVYTYDALERIKVDVKRRKFIWKGGKKLSIEQVAERLHKAKPDMPLEYIEDAVIGWLEEASMPGDLDDGDAEHEHQERIEAWIEAHNEKGKVRG